MNSRWLAQLAGLLNALGWSLVAIDASFALAYAWLLFAHAGVRRDATSSLDPDLRRKVLDHLDGLERTDRIRVSYAHRAAPDRSARPGDRQCTRVAAHAIISAWRRNPSRVPAARG
jgi:hypothetical protein